MTNQVQRTYSGAPWESKVGYCRGIKAGNHIYVTGTASIDDQGESFAPGKAYEQTRRCLEIIDKALQELGAGLSDSGNLQRFVSFGIEPEQPLKGIFGMLRVFWHLGACNNRFDSYFCTFYAIHDRGKR